MNTEPVVIVARQPVSTAHEPTGRAFALVLFAIEVILLFASVVWLNLVIETNSFMWSMTIFGAVVITIVLSMASSEIFERKKRH